jgi:hypothetical protein
LETYLDGHLRQWTFDAILGLPFTGSAYRAPTGEVVWFDPPDPGADETALLELGKPAHILVTFRDHDRAVTALAERYGAQVWIPRGEGGEIRPVHHEYGEDTALPAGLRAIAMPAVGFGEHALVAEAYGKRFAFIGDAVFNLEATKFPGLVAALFFHKRHSPLRMKRKYRGGDTPQAPAQIRKLLDLKLDAIFLSHGRAIPEHADQALRGALGER